MLYPIHLISILKQRPQAIAQIAGSPDHPNISGRVLFYTVKAGVVVVSIISSLPTSADKCGSPVLGFLIHNGTSCSGDESDYFKDALSHYNPRQCPHPYHAGDMPPLFSAGGTAFSAFLTDRFTVGEVIGKTVIIHSASDDFTTQPSGNAGMKIACGKIKET